LLALGGRELQVPFEDAFYQRDNAGMAAMFLGVGGLDDLN
jgi:hypothetical protein